MLAFKIQSNVITCHLNLSFMHPCEKSLLYEYAMYLKISMHFNRKILCISEKIW